MQTRFGVSALCTALVMVGCANEVSPSAPGDAPVQGETEELGIGSRGDAVRALHTFLTRYGYFPNVELERQYPSWRPLVDAAPSKDDVFDQQTAAAVVKLQAQYGLEQTGIDKEKILVFLKADPDGKGSVQDQVTAEMTSELMKVMGISGRQSADEVRRIRDVLGKDSEE